MKVAYISRTGNVKKFTQKTEVTDVFEIVIGTEKLTEPFVLITYTEGYGEVPDEIEVFLENNGEHLRGVAASGKKHYWDAYCIAADTISEKYHVPVLLKFEEDGTEEDVQTFVKKLKELEV